MKLTDYTDYSLRVLIYLAANPKTTVTIRHVSDTFGISKNHLVKIVQHLGQAGYIHTTRGRSGGICLGRRAADINIGAVIRVTEPDFGLVECFREGNRCVITRTCGLRGILHQALQAYLEVLDGYSLQDLMDKSAAINQLQPSEIPVIDLLHSS